MTGPGKRDDELRAAVARRDPRGHGRIARRAGAPGGASPPRPAAASAGHAPGGRVRGRPARAGPARRRRRRGQVRDGRRGPRRSPRAGRSRSPHLELLGLHAFGASNVLDAAALVDARRGDRSRGRAQLARAGRHDRPARRRRRRPRDPVRAARGVARPGRARARARARSSPTGPPTRSSRDARLLLEPGRFLVGPAGAYLARVVDRKTVDGSTVVILDGGVHHVLRPALVGQEHRIRVLSAARRPRAGGWCR